MRFSPHLTFDGQCRAAFEFYERVLGGKIVTMLSYGGSPMADKSRRNGKTRSFTRI